MGEVNNRVVYVYVHGFMPDKNGAGKRGRAYSNIRAYLDLGYAVELVCFQSASAAPLSPMLDLGPMKSTLVRVQDTQGGSLGKMAYLLGWPLEQRMAHMFKGYSKIRAEVQARACASPGALHHFEYMGTACATLPNILSIWSLNDIESDYEAGYAAARDHAVSWRVKAGQRLLTKRLHGVERRVARRARLIMCIAKHECQFIRAHWPGSRAAFFPMSIPVEDPVPRDRAWAENGTLRILHVGRPDTLPSYTSLQFLLSEVFPCLDERIRNRLEFLIVGAGSESDLFRRVAELARPYPQVRFLGFHDNLRQVYAESDLQAVGCTIATGLRTRIIESFAYGVPVLSTTVGAAGVGGIQAGDNIMIADGPREFADRLTNLVEYPSQLASVARNARRTYESIYSRRAVADRLSRLLTHYVL